MKYSGPQEGLANGTMKKKKWDSQDTISLGQSAEVDSPLQPIPIAGGRVLVRLATNIKEDL